MTGSLVGSGLDRSGRGTVLLQGGAEFGAQCRDMDAQFVTKAVTTGHGGPVVITALAGASGREYDTANANGVRHFRDLLGAHPALSGRHLVDVVAAPDARRDPVGAVTMLRSASAIVLPGGSPSRLLNALQNTGVAEVLHEHLNSGRPIMGASAGAMVLCSSLWLPDSGLISAGLGLVPHALVLPHFHPGAISRLGPTPNLNPDTWVLGLPEESGLVVSSDDAGRECFSGVGAQASTVIKADGSVVSVRVGGSLERPARMTG